VYLQLRAFANRPEELAQRQAQVRHGLLLIAIAATGIALLWVTLFLRHERAVELKEFRAKEQLDALERQRLQEQLRREEEELKRREAEKQVLEARTKLYADISVLAGSYAHNIKNLLVRPNDLLDRCLHQGPRDSEEHRMLTEARESLRAVSERTQQILRTVRRDLEPPQPQRIDLNDIAEYLRRQWHTLAEQQWKLHLRVVPAERPVYVAGDISHVQQALENLLCNARDATFEERNRLREIARSNGHMDQAQKHDALLRAAAWRGEVTLTVTEEAGFGVIALMDNGIGMTEEIRHQCTAAHFSTKRDNAMHEGLASGMGLGLSFVAWVVDQHQGQLIIESARNEGTTVRLRFPLWEEPKLAS
jgi:signal transduction histidine kinase